MNKPAIIGTTLGAAVGLTVGATAVVVKAIESDDFRPGIIDAINLKVDRAVTRIERWAYGELVRKPRQFDRRRDLPSFRPGPMAHTSEASDYINQLREEGIL